MRGSSWVMWLLNGDDVDVGVAQRLEDSLKLPFEHGKVTIDESRIGSAGEDGPRVDSHRGAHRRAVHGGGSPPRRT